MKVLVIVLALVAMACAYDVEDISPVMRDRLDRFVDMTQRWHSKWTTMTLGEQQHYEQVLLARLEELPKVEIQRLRHRIEALSPEKRLQLVQFLARRFQIENIDKYDNEIDAINGIVQALPEYARERIRDMIRTGFQEASAFAASDDEEGEVCGTLRLAFNDFKIELCKWHCRWVFASI